MSVLARQLMDPVGTPIALLALAVAGHAVAWFFKTPKETAGEMAQRVNALEDDHHQLDRGFYEFRATVLGELRNLTDAINRLSAAIGHEKITQSGEHRVVKRRGE